MSVFERLGGRLVPGDLLASADALVVLDGAECDLRLAAGVDLLRRGFAPRLVVVQSRYHDAQHGPARAAAGARPREVFLVPCSAVSTAEEAAVISPILRAWGCASVLIVTSWYHTRRARTVFVRRLQGSGVRVSTYPVAVPGASRHGWWKSRLGRRTVALEYMKLMATWLHLDLPGARGLRFRVKEWLVPSAVQPEQERPKAEERKAA